jgi:hypothetical protein
MIKKLLSFTLGMLAALNGLSQNSELKILKKIEKDFRVIDYAVWLVEKYDPITLKSSLTDKLPFVLTSFKKSMSSFDLDTLKCTSDNSLKEFVKCYTISLIDATDGHRIDNFHKDNLKSLYHHTLKLFNNDLINGGKDFDENLLSIYHQHRLRFHQMVENEKMRHELTQQITLLSSELDVLCDSVILLKSLMRKQYDLLKLTTGSTKVLTEDQQRDEKVSQLFSRRKWRYLASTKLTKQDLDAITEGKDRRVARRELKSVLKSK